MSAKKKKIVQERVSQNQNIRFLPAKTISKGHLSQRKFRLLSELTACLYASSRECESYRHLSNVIVLTLKASEDSFLDKTFVYTESTSEANFAPRVETLKKVHRLLLHANSMSKKERCEYLDSERFLLKLRLDKMIGKY